MRRPHPLAALAFALSFLASAPASADIVGTGDVSPTLPWNSSGDGYVGKTSDGSLTVNLGSILSSAYGYLGYSPGSTGTATVTGTGSTWTNSYSLYVGYGGAGTLTVDDGATVTAKTLYASLANLLGNGTITTQGAVLDANLVFDAAHPLQQTVTFGSGGSLKVNPSATVNLGVGYKTAGTLRIADGIAVSSGSGFLGYNAGSTGAATVTGAGSTWTNSVLLIGNSGAGTLMIEAGGKVSNSSSYIGYNAGSTGTATVTGAGSTWTNNGSLCVGYDGAGTLRVDNGATVTATTLFASLNNLLGNGTITTQGAVLDAPLIFDATHPLQQTIAFGSGGALKVNPSASVSLGVGYKATGTLRIADGIVVSSSSGYLGYKTGSIGTATVSGAGSTWVNSNSIYVGYGGAGTLRVDDGATVTAATIYASLGNLLGNGTITTQGAVLDAALIFDATHPLRQTLSFGSGGSLKVSASSSGALGAGHKGTGTLRIADGVVVSSSSGYLGHRTGSTGTATVTGAGSAWTNDDLIIGASGAGTLTIEAGGQVSNASGFLGLDSGSTGTATVTGAGSTWTNSDGLYVGFSGAGVLTIKAGGKVSGNFNDLGYKPGSTGTATVTGAGSTWTNSGSLYVGDSGVGTLKIESGSTVTNTSGYLGYSKGSTGTATVTGAGSTWTNSTLYVGNYGAGTLKIEAGGKVSNSGSGYLGYETGTGGTATVTGADSTWTNSSELYIGNFGTATLTIEAGGKVSNSSGYLGRYTGSTGTAMVTGTGSTWTNSSILYVGYSGTGTLTIEAGGLTVAKTLTLANNSGSTGTFSIDGGGTLRAGTFTKGAGTAIFTWNDGTIQNYDTATDLSIAAGVPLKLAATGIHAFQIDTNRTGTVSAVVNDATTLGTLTKTGLGKLILSGVNTYTGETTIAAGTLSASSIVVSGGGSNLGNATSAIILGDSTNQGTLLYTGAAATYTRGFTVNAGGGQLTNSGTGALTVSTGGIATGGLFTVGGASQNITINSTISGGGGLTKTGADTVTLNAANTFTGTTTIAAGTLSASNIVVSGGGSNLGTATSAVILGDSANQGTLLYTGGAVTYTRGFTVSAGGGQLTNSGTGTLTVDVGEIAAGGLFTVGGASQNISINSTFSGIGGLTKTGTNTVILSAANSFTGTTTIAAGTLSTSSIAVSDGGSNLGNATSPVVLGSSTNQGTLLYTGGTATYTRGFTVNYGGGQLTNSGTGTLTVDVGGIVAVGLFTVGGASQDITINSPISGTGGLTKTGTNTVILGGVNSYTGDTKISAGTLQLGNNLALQNSVLDTSGTGTLAFSADINMPTFGGLTGSGNCTLAANVTGLTLNLGSGATKTYSGILGNATAGMTLTKTGLGTQILSGSNTYTGTTTIAAGTLSANKIVVSSGGSNLGNATSSVILGDSANQGTLLYTGGVATYTRGFTVNAGGGQLTNSGTGALTVNTGGIAAGGLFTVGGASKNITINSTISGAGGLTKTGANTLILGGANSFTGDTTISAGTLQLGNNLALQNSALDTSGTGTLAFSTGINTPTFGGLVGSGNRTLASNVTGLTLNLGSGVTKRYSGILGSATAGMMVTKTGAGTQVFTGANTYTGKTTVQAGTLVLGTAAQNAVLNLGGADLQAGKLVFDYTGGTTPAATIAGMLGASYNAGAWNTGQFQSTTAGSTHGLGWVDDGVSQVKVAYTFYGDADLNGTVNSADLAKVLANYNMAGMAWSQGDFDYNGTVNSADLAKVLANYNLALPDPGISGSFAGLDATAIELLAEKGREVSAVPEPGTMALLMTALAGLLVWQRKGKSGDRS